MESNSQVKVILFFLSLLLLWAAACRPTNPDNSTMSDQDRKDFQKMMDQAPPGQPIQLDFSDPVHYRFYTKQLALAGITPELYPKQFEVLKESKEQHEKSGPPKLERPLLAEATANSNIAAIIAPIQTITSLGTSDGSNFTSSALSSVANDPYVSQLTLGIYDQNNNPIGTPVYQQQQNSGEDLQLDATGTLTSTAANSAGDIANSVATYFWQGQNGSPHHGYVRAATSSVLNTAPTTIDNIAPSPAAGQTIIKLCLGRTGTDCTYIPSGGSGSNVIMPIQGSITFSSNINTSPPTPNTSLITIARPDPGEGGGTTISSTDDFFSQAVISGKTISWNLSPAHFQPANGVLVANSQDIYTFTLGLTVANLPVYVSITNDPGTSSNDFNKKIADLWVYFSCLAEGSRVRLSNGSSKAIEDVVEGDELITNSAGRIMCVDSKLKGKEEVPMVRVKTENGRELLLTDGHPVLIPEGVTLARMLEVGDEVMTDKGISALVEVSREDYDGYVWNLNVGPPQDDISNISDQTTFYANGILVGDNQMQFKHNRLHKHTPTSILKALPEEWHQDYYNYEKEVARGK